MEDFPFISLWSGVSEFTAAGGDLEQSAALESLLRKHRPQLLKPNPFAQAAASGATNKNELLEGKLAGSENISQAHRQALVDMVEELDITVDLAMKCWTAVADDRTRRILESELGLKIGELDRDLPGAARSLYFYNHNCLLLSLRQLLQSRYHTGLSEENRALIIRNTNDLLRSGLISELIKAIVAITERTKQRPAKRGDTSVEEVLSLISECLFFACYETQIEIAEAQLLLDTIKSCSEFTMFDRESSSFSTGDGFSFTQAQHSSMNLLTVLLCTFACGLSQTRVFLTRREDDNGYTFNDFVGNALAPPEGVPQGTIPITEIYTMHERIYVQSWDNKYVQGFVRLVWALFCAGSDERTLEAQGTRPQILPFKVLDKALRSRVFSFISKCICPARQFFYEDQQQLLYLDVLAEVLENTMNLIALDIANAQQTHGFNSTARHIHLLSRAEWISNRASARQMTGEIRRHAALDEDLDCWDEILEAMTGFAKLYPPFAEKFWPASGTSPPHPILESAAECMDRDDTLLVPVLNLLTAFAAAPDPRIAWAVYNFVHGLARNWHHFLWCIHSYVVALGGEVQGNRATRLSDGPARTQLRADDVKGLVAIVSLLDKVLVHQQVRDALFRVEEEALAPIPNLFALAACQVPPELKGAVFCAIGRFAQLPEATALIWRLLEEYQVVPTGPRQRMAGPLSISASTASSGIIYELEQVEARQGSYPATEGFLVLLHSLMSCSIPNTLGEGYRRPGVLPYLVFVLDHVLMRCTGRHYDAQHHGAVWRIATLALKIFLVVLQSYHINSLPTVPLKLNGQGTLDRASLSLPPELEQFELDFHEPQASVVSSRREGHQDARIKTGQFEVMNWMLSESKLLQCIEEFIAMNSIKELTATKKLQQQQGIGRALLNMQRFHEALAGRLRVTQGSISAVNVVLQDPGLMLVDSAYWKERLVLMCIGLLYETSIREDRFIHRVSKARDLVGTTLNAETGWEEHYAVQVQHLPYLLASHTRLSPLPVLSHFIQYTGPASEIPIMVSKILEHTGKVLNATDLLATIRSADHRLLVTGCVRRLMMEDPPVDAATMLTSTDADDRSVSFSGLDFERDAATKLVDEQTEGAITMEQYAFGSTSGTPAVREAILDLLLGQVTSPTANTHATLAHVLLGLEKVLEGRSVQLDDPRPGHPVNCLEAILMMLDLPDTSARLAEKGFQLIYRLCASPLTMEAVLGLLRRRNVDFIQHHLQKFLLLGPANIYGSERDRSASIGRESPEDAHVYRQMSCAWLLKVTALEFRSLTVSQSMVPHKAIQLLAMLFAEGSMPSVVSRQPEIALVRLLDAITVGDAPSIAIHNSLVLQCMQQSYVPLSKEPELQQYSAIDVMTLLHNIRDAFPPVQAPPTPGMRGQAAAIVTVPEQLPAMCADAVNVAVKYNRFTRQLAAAGHFHYAWWQVVSVALMGSGKLLLNRVLGGDIANGLRHIVSSLLDPILHMLADSPSLQMPIAEPLAKTAVVIINFVRTSASEATPIFTLDQTLTYLELAIQAVLRRGGPAGGALESSATYRGHMYAFFVHFLRYLQLSVESPTSEAQPAPAATSRPRFGASSDPAAQLQQKIAVGCVQILEAYAEALVVRVSPDLAHSTPCWRALAMSCLSVLLSGLNLRSGLQTDVTRGSEYASAFGSAAMHQALDALFGKGQLQLLLLAINPERPGSTGSADGAGPVYDELSVSLYVAAVSLCTQVASTPYGAKVLLENGILERINGVETLRAPPTGAGIADDPFAPARDASIRNLEEQLFESQLIPTLTLLRTIVAVLPRHRAVLTGCAAFLTRNHQTVTAILHLRTRTLNSLIHAESLISMMNFVLKGLRGVEHHLGEFAATFSADICHLQAYIGAAPLPPLQYTMRGAAHSSWWTDIVPVSAFDRELQQTPPPANLNPIRRKPDWSAFEYRKLILGIKILRHTATFLRLRCQSITEGRMSALEAEVGAAGAAAKEESAKKRAKTAVPPVDLEKVIVPFLVCYEEATTLRPQGELDSQLWPANEDVDALGGVMDTDSIKDYVVRSLQFVLENLVCVLHDTLEASKQPGTYSSEGFKKALGRFVDLVDSKFISHSFLRRVGRRIKERSALL